MRTLFILIIALVCIPFASAKETFYSSLDSAEVVEEQRTGAADRIMQRGDADLKFARMIWVIFSWFAAGVIAVGAGALVCKTVFTLGVAGIAISVAANLTVRHVLKKRGDAQDKRIREQAYDRMYPERLTDYEG